MAAKRKSSSWQARDCPVDFDVIFVEKGRLECESHYRARRSTITRWLVERGKARLIKKRADFVKYQRQSRKRKGIDTAASPPKDRRKIDPDLAKIACRYLQSKQGGGWVAYQHDEGGFVVGVKRLTSGQMLDMAICKGFDRRKAEQQIRLFAEPN